MTRRSRFGKRRCEYCGEMVTKNSVGRGQCHTYILANAYKVRRRWVCTGCARAEYLKRGDA